MISYDTYDMAHKQRSIDVVMMSRRRRTTGKRPSGLVGQAVTMVL